MNLPRQVSFLGMLVLAAGLVAAPHTVGLSFAQLQLSTGAPLGAGVIRSYDPANGRVMLQVGQSARSVSIEQLPEALQQRLRTLVPFVPEKSVALIGMPAVSATAKAAGNPAAKASPVTAGQDQANSETVSDTETSGEARPAAPDPRETARAAAKLFLNRNRFTPAPDVSGAKAVSTYVLDDAVQPATGTEQRYLVTGHYEMKIPGRTGGGSVVGQYPFTVSVQLDPSGRPREISIELH